MRGGGRKFNQSLLMVLVLEGEQLCSQNLLLNLGVFKTAGGEASSSACHAVIRWERSTNHRSIRQQESNCDHLFPLPLTWALCQFY